MHRIYKTDGIILKRRNISEADKILTVLTPYYGKISLLAKGIRRIRSRRAAHIELFHYAQLTVARGKTWDIVTEAQTRQSFPSLRESLTKIAYAYRIAETVDALCGENQAHPALFAYVQEALYQLEKSDNDHIAAIVDGFTSKVLWELGYLPKTQQLKGVHLQGFLLSITEHAMRSDRLLEKVV